MTGIAILLLAAAVAQALSRWMDVPSTPFVLLLGVVLGQLGLIPVEILQETLVLGLTFLLLVLGIELNPRRLRIRSQRRTALRVGLLQFTAVGGAGLLVALLLGFDRLTASYVGIALAASSTLVVVRLLQRKGRLFEPFGRLVVGVLLVQDAAVILGMPVITRAPYGLQSVLLGVAGTGAMIALAVMTMRWISPRLARLDGDDEVLLISVMAVPFVFIGLADWLALPLAAGAFVGGLALSPFPTSGIVRAQLASVGDFFTPVFFLALGGIITTPSPETVLQALVLVAVLLLLTPPLVAFLMERGGLEARPALESGLIIAQTSELSLVIGLHALLLEQITQDTFTVLAMVTMATMALTPYVSSERSVHTLLRLHPLRRQEQRREPARDHVVLLGCGSGGMPLLETLLMAGEEVVVVDDDPEVVSRLRSADIRCIRGDASDEDVLRRAAVDRASVISSTIRRPRDNARALDLIRDRPFLVRVFEDEDARWVEERGGIPVLYSDAAAEEFARWFAEEGDKATS
ncbi:MAG TPA: cation:proton antiporter [Longimicrobiales bacterium]|nr:cation:proton antiporter [Longimicrobiales bacterium]